MQQFILGVLVGVVVLLTAEHLTVLHASTVATEIRIIQQSDDYSYKYEDQSYYGGGSYTPQPRKEM